MAKKAKHRVQYTIRSIPPPVDRALRQRARMAGRSLNETIVDVLQRAAGISSKPVLHHDLDHLIGAWVEDPEFDRMMAEQNVIDPGVWK